MPARESCREHEDGAPRPGRITLLRRRVQPSNSPERDAADGARNRVEPEHSQNTCTVALACRRLGTEVE